MRNLRQQIGYMRDNNVTDLNVSAENLVFWLGEQIALEDDLKRQKDKFDRLNYQRHDLPNEIERKNKEMYDLVNGSAG